MALRVGLRAIGRLRGPHERQQDRVEIEERAAFDRGGQHLAILVVATLVLQVDGDRLGHPVRDAVAGLRERDRVHILVADHVEPVEEPQVLLAAALARDFHRDHRPRARRDRVDRGQAGEPHPEPLVIGHEFDARAPRRCVAEPRADLLVHRIELRKHVIGHRIIDAWLRTKREVTALAHGPWRHVLEQAKAQRGPDVEWIALDGRSQRLERACILARLHVHQAELHWGLAPLGRAVPRPAQQHRSVLVLAAPRQHAAHLKRCVRAAGRDAIGIGEGLLHRLGPEAHRVHGS